MQLTKWALIISIFCNFSVGFTQDEKPIDVDFIFNYYDQDGDHSSVTGGKGTEDLTNLGSKIIINIPNGNDANLNISLNADSYTSASSDNINPVRSGASGHDLHVYGHGEYSVELPESDMAYSFGLGVSSEFDYKSVSLGGSLSFYSSDKNRQFSISTMNFFDFINLIYPIELRGNGKLLNDEQRQTFSLSFNYNQVINTKMQIALMTDLIFQKGLLSTPFNRVYFKDDPAVDVERLPNSRFKFPVGMRFTYLLSESFVMRFYYRYYNDSFGLSSQTISTEIPIRINQTWAVIPFIRYHKQTEMDYFAPYSEHSISENYYSSDYDLSGFNSSKTGLGLRYYPIDGLGQIGDWRFKRVDLRAALYDRSDGLKSFNISLGFSFTL